MHVNALAGTPAPISLLTDLTALLKAYYDEIPDPAVASQRVEFGTSGHRGSALRKSFNENHILAITQAICEYRAGKHIDGPLFLGLDTHALSMPAMRSALEVLAANHVDVMLAEGDEFTPTPVISHAILTHNRTGTNKVADGIVITPSHNPPDEGGFKYNSSNGGPADTDITNWIEGRANALLRENLREVKRIDYDKALKATTTHRHNYIESYVSDLSHVIDMSKISSAGIRLGVDPLGGASVHYWKRIGEKYGLSLTVTNEIVDPTFRFMTLDWDGKIRMDPSSKYAMGSLIALKDQFDIAVACDTDADRHGIVTKSSGLLPPNHYLSVAIYYLCQHRPLWHKGAAIAKTVVTTQMIDRIAKELDRPLYEVPVGFKWFVDGLLTGQIAFAAEESAGASFLRFDGTPWSTDKDGIIAGLLAAEITASCQMDPGALYKQLIEKFGAPAYGRVEAVATPAQKARLKSLSPQDVPSTSLAGQPITSILTLAPGNGAAIGGLKVVTQDAWFAARPSGTEEIYKIYGESFKGEEHLRQIFQQSQEIVDKALQGALGPMSSK